MSELSETRSKPIEQSTRKEFPKCRRILRSPEFRAVYDNGFRVTGPFFAAFCLRKPETGDSRVGFTAPRALGKAVVRNRIKRRVREAVRLNLARLAPGWDVVLNPRRAAAEAPFEKLLTEVERVFSRCAAS